VRKRPEIPEDVFFNVAPTATEADDATEEMNEVLPPEGEPLAKSMEEAPATEPSHTRRAEPRRRAPEPEPEPASKPARVGRPPAQEGPKVAVTLYLTEPVALMLEEVKFLLLTEYDVRTSKSAIADFAMRNGLRDLQAAADDLRRD